MEQLTHTYFSSSRSIFVGYYIVCFHGSDLSSPLPKMNAPFSASKSTMEASQCLRFADSNALTGI